MGITLTRSKHSAAVKLPDRQAVRPKYQKLSVTSHGISDRGRMRESNEDCFVIAEFARNLSIHLTNIHQPESKISCHRGHAFLVADGVGGHKAGEVASMLSAMTIEEFLLNTFKSLTSIPPGEEQSVLSDLHAALFQADSRLFNEAARHPEWRGMGTTLTMAFAVNRQLLIAHAGDSRCYLFSDGRLQQITQDHTVSAEMERDGLISRQELKSHQWRHVVSNLLGGSQPGVRVELHSLEIHPEDVILLCSDGLTEMVSEDAMMEILRREPEPRSACEKLVAEANRMGGEDNVTVIVARFDDVATG
jgi:serine/threonine protein phosphatase PrpC